jgi:xanthine/uracil permease
MSNPGSNINFSFEYVVSLIVVLIVCNLLIKSNPEMNTLVVILAGLVVGFIVLYIMNNIFPHINKTASDVGQYYQYQWMNNFNSAGYVHVWPPILAVLIVFVVLLYNRQLG